MENAHAKKGKKIKVTTKEVSRIGLVILNTYFRSSRDNSLISALDLET